MAEESLQAWEGWVQPCSGPCCRAPGWWLCLGHPPLWEGSREVAGVGDARCRAALTQTGARERQGLVRPGLAEFCLGCGGLGEQLSGDSAPRGCSFHSLPASSSSSRARRSAGQGVGDAPSYPAHSNCPIPSVSLRGVAHTCAHAHRTSRLHVCTPTRSAQAAHLRSPAQGRGVAFLCHPPPHAGSQLWH